MYNLNPNSYVSRFYSWLWDTDVRKFKNMCPYFWKYVFTILFIWLILPVKMLMMLAAITPIRSSKMDKVYTVIAESTTVSYINRFFKWIVSFDDFWYTVGKFLKWTLIAGISIICAFIFGMLVYLAYLEPMTVLALTSVVAISISVLYFIIYLFTEKNLGKLLWIPFKLCGNMVYNLYKDVCPMVTWK
jgi:hypothetical protein